MKPLKPTTYQTVDEVEAVVREREAEAELLSSGAEKQALLLEIAKLRAYAKVKRGQADHPKERSAIH
jgi:hypothetical protein